jgi:membrane protein YdbS with pleckstrin-like domain
LDPRVVRLWRVQALVWTVGVALSVGAAGWLLDFQYESLAAASVMMLAGLLAALLWPPARYRSWSFTLRDSDVVLRRGVWWRVTSIVPHSRIQHVDTTHGPLERKLGLSSVVMFTAGSVGASMTIPGLPAAEADELRDTLATLARIGEAV